MRYPEITKKMSTPIKPPENPIISVWAKITSITATALNPSISGMNLSGPEATKVLSNLPTFDGCKRLISSHVDSGV